PPRLCRRRRSAAQLLEQDVGGGLPAHGGLRGRVYGLGEADDAGLCERRRRRFVPYGAALQAGTDLLRVAPHEHVAALGRSSIATGPLQVLDGDLLPEILGDSGEITPRDRAARWGRRVHFDSSRSEVLEGSAPTRAAKLGRLLIQATSVDAQAAVERRIG